MSDNNTCIGLVGYNNFGSKMTIIGYNKANDITVMFEDGYIKKGVRKWCFDNGKVYSPYERKVYCIGYLGEGKYTYKDKNRKIYKLWQSMLQRCYDNKLKEKFETYKGCTVCKEWHNFQNFARWYNENYYEVKGEIICLDKDILIKGNKIYSPETCIFAPTHINNIFTKSDKSRGEYPIGVSRSSKNRYSAMINITQNKTKERKCIGIFSSEYEAFICYKDYKEKIIKELADKYKSKIPQKLYDAMYKYEVEITD